MIKYLLEMSLKWLDIIPASKLGYLASQDNFDGCLIVDWDPLNAKRSCPKNGMGYVKMHGFHGNP